MHNRHAHHRLLLHAVARLWPAGRRLQESATGSDSCSQTHRRWGTGKRRASCTWPSCLHRESQSGCCVRDGCCRPPPWSDMGGTATCALFPLNHPMNRLYTPIFHPEPPDASHPRLAALLAGAMMQVCCPWGGMTTPTAAAPPSPSCWVQHPTWTCSIPSLGG